MKYEIKTFSLGSKVYYVIFDNVNDTSSHLFATKEEAEKALQVADGKPAHKL
tara:strand:+ start:142 stop:297 length:156 start_codon:yes stop_codon:yes gene_type:complete